MSRTNEIRDEVGKLLNQGEELVELVATTPEPVSLIGVYQRWYSAAAETVR